MTYDFRYQFFGGFPRHCGEGFGAAFFVVCTGTGFQPALAYHRCFNPRGRIQYIDDARADGRDIVVLFETVQGLNFAILGFDAIGAPMCTG